MKIVGKFVLILCLAQSLFSASAHLSSNEIQAGDRVALILVANGKEVKFPELSSIEGNEVVSTSQSQNIQSINGNVTRVIQKQYEFYPSTNITIPSYEIEVDGKLEKTEQLSLHVKKVSSKNTPYLLDVSLSNDTPYQNEGIVLRYIFKIKNDIKVRDLRFALPSFDGFWIKEGKKTNPKVEGDYILHEISYIVFAQQAGDIEIKPARIDIGLDSYTQDMFNMLTRSIEYKRVFSEAKTLHVKKLEGTNFIGDFEIIASIDKDKIASNENVNMTVKIVGYGNFDDLHEIKLDTKANIFSDKPVIKSEIVGDKLQGEFEQKLSLSSDKDFVINPIEFTYFSLKEAKVKTIKSQKFNIQVEKKELEKEIFIQAPKKQQEKIFVNQKEDRFWYGYLLGIMTAFGFLTLYFLKAKLKFKREKDFGEKSLLKRLLKIRNKDKKAEEYISLIETYLYKDKTTKLNKKEIVKFIKSYEE